MQRSIGVTLSAVFVFIGCGLTVLFLGFGILGVMLAPQPSLNVPIMHVLLIVEMLFGLGFAGWGVASGVGLLNLREWARISMIVFSAIMVFFSLFPLLVLAFMPIPQPPGTPPNFMLFIRVGIGLFYGFFAALGAFWIYFFNRRSVREQFKRGASVEAATLTSNAPEMSPSLADATPHKPVLIVLIAIFLILGSCFIPFIFLLHSPMFFFGVALQGRAAGVCLALFGVLGLVAGIGLLRLRPWGWLSALAYQGLGLVNMACLVLIPGATDRMFVRMMQYEESRGMPTMPPGFAFPTAFMRISLIFGIALGIGILWALFAYRKVFRPTVSAAI